MAGDMSVELGSRSGLAPAVPFDDEDADTCQTETQNQQRSDLLIERDDTEQKGQHGRRNAKALA